jgi:hypothetical protein
VINVRLEMRLTALETTLVRVENKLENVSANVAPLYPPARSQR